MTEGHRERAYRDAISKAQALLKDYIKLGNDILVKVSNEYNKKSFDEFRIILLSYLRIAVENSEAALILLENNYTCQIHYINRNMIEMITNLAYICKSSINKEEASKRFEHYDVIMKIKGLKQVDKYPEILGGAVPVSAREKVESNKEDYISRYGSGKHNTWSGKSLYQMIGEVTDLDFGKSLKRVYDITTTIDNQYLHAGPIYVKEIISGTSNEVWKQLLILELLLHYLDMFIFIYFESNFSKGRPAFRARREEFQKRTRDLLEFKNSTGIV